MENNIQGRLAGWDTHGFRTIADLDVDNIMDEAKARWLRPNEIYAILYNYAILRDYEYFSINVKPVNLPKSGTIVLFDRKKLKRFRSDGHNWKKKKDGKTVKEAHEHLKVGNEERIHVYYAHGEDNSTFVRRCYWLLDKTLEHIVLVHYRETQELQGSPGTPVNSNSSSGLSYSSASWLLPQETDRRADAANYIPENSQFEPGDNMIVRNHEWELHKINTLEWDELLKPDDLNKLSAPDGGKTSCCERQNQYRTNDLSSIPSANKLPEEGSLGSSSEPDARSYSIGLNTLDSPLCQNIGGNKNVNLRQEVSEVTVDSGNTLDILSEDGLRTQESFGRWMNYILTDSPGSVDDPILESSIPTGHELSTLQTMEHPQSFVPGQLFNITDVSPTWAFSTEGTKILVTGFFNDTHQHLSRSDIYCVCGDECYPAEMIQSGVFRCLLSPHTPGLVNLYFSLDACNPISQVMTFEYRTPLVHNSIMCSENTGANWDDYRVQMRLAHLLFSTTKSLSIFSSQVPPDALKEAKIFANKTSHIVDGWAYTMESVENNQISLQQAKDSLFELTLKNKLYEWLLERVVEGVKTSDHDDQGQGIIHLCAILDYTWAVCPFAWSGLSLDYRDKFGWTALHWAAYCGREKMVAALLSAGAKPNLVTDPNSENRGGCTAADLASRKGHEGLAAYLAEKALVEHLKDMTIAGNVSGSLQNNPPDLVKGGNVTEEELYLKESLAAYRTAADAAARIQAAFREQSFKLRTKAVQFSNKEDEARDIVAAMKIQHAFRNYETRKQMSAAVRIQHRFRTWKMRKDFLNLRRHAIRIQAVYRGFQVRKHYRKICWSVGVLEKALLRWRKKRRGLRPLQVCPVEAMEEQNHESDAEDFFKASRQQAEERVERSVVRVQAMFRSKKVQQEYQRMKLVHDQAKLQYEVLASPDTDMG